MKQAVKHKRRTHDAKDIRLHCGSRYKCSTSPGGVGDVDVDMDCVTRTAKPVITAEKSATYLT